MSLAALHRRLGARPLVPPVPAGSGYPVRVGMVSEREVPDSLVGHVRDLVAAAAGEGEALAGPTRFRVGPLRAVGLAARLAPGDAAACERSTAKLAADVRAPAIALGVDIALTHGTLAEHGPDLLVMDVDSTLVTAEVIELLAEHAGTAERVAAITDRAMRGEIDFAASLHERVATLAGLDSSVLDEVRAAIRFTPGALELVEALQDRGTSVGAISGGFVEVVEPLVLPLGIHLSAGNELEITATGTLTGRTSGAIVDRAAKARYLRSWARKVDADLSATVAVGDGANDLDMLDTAALGIAYRAKPILAESADAVVTAVRLDAILALLGIASADDADE